MSIKDANKLKIRRYKNKVVLLDTTNAVKCFVGGEAVDITDKPKQKSARTLKKERKYQERKQVEDKFEILDPALGVRCTKAQGYFTMCNTKSGKSKTQKWRTMRGDFTRKPTPRILGDKMPCKQVTRQPIHAQRKWDDGAPVPKGGVKYSWE